MLNGPQILEVNTNRCTPVQNSTVGIKSSMISAVSQVWKQWFTRPSVVKLLRNCHFISADDDKCDTWHHFNG